MFFILLLFSTTQFTYCMEIFACHDDQTSSQTKKQSNSLKLSSTTPATPPKQNKKHLNRKNLNLNAIQSDFNSQLVDSVDLENSQQPKTPIVNENDNTPLSPTSAFLLEQLPQKPANPTRENSCRQELAQLAFGQSLPDTCTSADSLNPSFFINQNETSEFFSQGDSRKQSQPRLSRSTSSISSSSGSTHTLPQKLTTVLAAASAKHSRKHNHDDTDTEDDDDNNDTVLVNPEAPSNQLLPMIDSTTAFVCSSDNPSQLRLTRSVSQQLNQASAAIAHNAANIVRTKKSKTDVNEYVDYNLLNDSDLDNNSVSANKTQKKCTKKTDSTKKNQPKMLTPGELKKAQASIEKLKTKYQTTKQQQILNLMALGLTKKLHFEHPKYKDANNQCTGKQPEGIRCTYKSKKYSNVLRHYNSNHRGSIYCEFFPDNESLSYVDLGIYLIQHSELGPLFKILKKTNHNVSPQTFAMLTPLKNK